MDADMPITPTSEKTAWLHAVATQDPGDMRPSNREEGWLYYAAGGDITMTPLSNDEYFVAQVAETLRGGGSTAGDIDALVDKTITSLTSNAAMIGEYACYACKALTNVNLPEALSIGDYAFYTDKSLKTLTAPKVKTVGQYAFTTAALTEIDLPECTEIGRNAFMSCASVGSINLPKVQRLGYQALMNACSASDIEPFDVTLPQCQSISDDAFASSRIGTLTLPAVVNLSSGALRSMARLTVVDIGTSAGILNNEFSGDRALSTLIIRGDTVAPLSSTGAFADTPWGLESQGGTLYVPEALIEDYKAAANWSTILGRSYNNILPIEGSEYE